MIAPSFTLDLSAIDPTALRTEEDFLDAARRLLPAVLLQVGDALGEKAWAALRKGGGGADPSPPAGRKDRFVQEIGKNYQRQANSKDRRELEGQIVARLKALKEKN